MKLLHTSDWHLGQSFFTKSRKQEHSAFLTWLLKQVELHQIDAVIVAGDIFDTGTPPSYAREMYNQIVVSMNQVGCALVILGGNHDSVSTLNESRQLLARLNTWVIANTSHDLSEQLIPLKSKNGDIGALLCAVPFIRPRDVTVSQSGESAQSKQQALTTAIQQHYHSLFNIALDYKQQHNLEVPILMTGHLTALGAQSSESVRDIYIGTLEGFDANLFPPADYIALGHIHRPQLVAKSEYIRYSGSPIPLSFDEIRTEKQVMMIDTGDAGEPVSVTPIPVPCFQPLATVKGSLEEIEEQIARLNFEVSPLPIWLAIEVNAQDYLSDLHHRIQNITEPYHVEVLQLRRARDNNKNTLRSVRNETLSELTPLEVFDKRLATEQFETEEQQIRKTRIEKLFHQIVTEVQQPE